MAQKIYSSDTYPDFLQSLTDNDACKAALRWGKQNPNSIDKHEIIPIRFHFWLIVKGYDQFVPTMPWGELTPDDWAYFMKAYDPEVVKQYRKLHG